MSITAASSAALLIIITATVVAVVTFGIAYFVWTVVGAGVGLGVARWERRGG